MAPDTIGSSVQEGTSKASGLDTAQPEWEDEVASGLINYVTQVTAVQAPRRELRWHTELHRKMLGWRPALKDAISAVNKACNVGTPLQAICVGPGLGDAAVLAAQHETTSKVLCFECRPLQQQMLIRAAVAAGVRSKVAVVAGDPEGTDSGTPQQYEDHYGTDGWSSSHPARMLILERFDAGCLGHRAVYIARHLRAVGLLAPDAIVFPARVHLHAVLLSADTTLPGGVDIAPMVRGRWAPHYQTVNPNDHGWTAVSEASLVITLDLGSDAAADAVRDKIVKFVSHVDGDRLVDAVGFYGAVDYTGSALPGECETLPRLAVQLMPSRPLAEVKATGVRSSHLGTRLWFEWPDAALQFQQTDLNANGCVSMEAADPRSQMNPASIATAPGEQVDYTERVCAALPLALRPAEYAMLSHVGKCEAFLTAIAQEVGANCKPSPRFVELGGQFGLLAALASRCGASKVRVLGAGPNGSKEAEALQRHNNLASQVKCVAAGNVPMLKIGWSFGVDVLATEMFGGGGGLGDGVIPLLRQLHSAGALHGATVIPSSLTIMAALVSTGHNGKAGAGDGATAEWVGDAVGWHDIGEHWIESDELLSSPVDLFELVLGDAATLGDDHRVVSFDGTRTGIADGIAVFFRLSFGGHELLGSEPGGGGPWGQTVYRIPEIEVKRGVPTADISASHDGVDLVFKCQPQAAAGWGGDPLSRFKDALSCRAHRSNERIVRAMEYSAPAKRNHVKATALRLASFPGQFRVDPTDTGALFEVVTEMGL